MHIRKKRIVMPPRLRHVAEHEARRIARTLVDERLAACVNILPTVRSVYWWDGEVQDDAEALLVIKTTALGFDALAERIDAEHPYDVPEIIEIPVGRGSEAYLQWVAGAVTAEQE